MNEIIQSSVYTTQKGTPVTDSVKVARVFDKLHKNVMKSIRNILGSAQNLANQNWFAETTYTDAQGKRQPMFLMNRDGFSLLTMSLTGEKAIRKHPNMVKLYVRYGQQWLDTHPNVKSHENFDNAFEMFVGTLFYESKSAFQSAKNGLFGTIDCKKILER